MKWIIGDVHGCYNTLMELISKIPEKNPELVFVGDLIDRGPDSRKVIDFVRNGGHKCVLGNHELMMLEAEKSRKGNDISLFSDWAHNGSEETLNCYIENGIFNEDAYLEDIAFLKSLEYVEIFFKEKDENGKSLVVSHSFCKHILSEPYSESFMKNMVWGRGECRKYLKDDNYFNVFGHTPTSVINNTGEVIIDKDVGYANIDTGCVYNKKKRETMTAISFPGLGIVQQQNIEEK